MKIQQTFDIRVFQFLSWLPTDYSIDKYHIQYIDICYCTNIFGTAVYIYICTALPKYYYTTKYPFTDCAIWPLNVHLVAKIGLKFAL